MDNILKCKNCDFSCTSEKIFWLHLTECKAEKSEDKAKSEKKDFNSLNWNDLRKYAVSKGIEIIGLKKEEIIEKLQTLEG